MRTGYHRVCGGASPDGDGAVEMASSCHLVRGGGNPACIDDGRYDWRSRESSDESESLSESDGKVLEDEYSMNPCPMNCRKTTARPLTLRRVVPESGEEGSMEQRISASALSPGIEQSVECSSHLQMLAHLFGKDTKSDTRKVIDRESRWSRDSSDILDSLIGPNGLISEDEFPLNPENENSTRRCSITRREA